MRTLERRAFALTDMQVRAAGGRNTFTGRAVVYGQISDDLGGWRERIEPGAATRTLGRNPDVRFLINHDANLLLGRTVSGTLRLAEADDAGVDVEADLPDTTAARDLTVLMERRDITQMSFGFWVESDSWDGNLHRVHEFDLDGGDVSVVTFPAYPQTSADLRAAAAARLAGMGGQPDTGDVELLTRALTHLRQGRTLPGATAEQIRQAVDALSTLLATPGTPAPPADGGPDLSRSRRRRELELMELVSRT